MDPEIVIRSETDADVDAITEVTIAAFKTMEISNQTEQFIIEALRAARAPSIGQRSPSMQLVRANSPCSRTAARSYASAALRAD